MNIFHLDQYKADQAGFSLVELMVAITLGLIVVASLAGIFVSSSQARVEIEKANRQIESGRFAVQLLAEDLRLAGFYAEFDPTVLTSPATKPDPCLLLSADLKAALPLHVQGYDNGDSTTLSCLNDVKVGTDILVVRRVSTCVVGSANCDASSTGTPYFQASLCQNASQLGSSNSDDFYALSSDVSTLNKHKRDCTTAADIRRYRTHIYFIANNNVGSDGMPTLKRAELGTSSTASTLSIVPLTEGIENMQFEYGIDTNNDSAPDVYTADPDSYAGCNPAACVTNWRNVVSVKVNLLARNEERTAGYSDTKIYSLGLKSDASANRFGPFNDSYKRHAYQTVVRLNNPAGRKEP